MIKEELKQKAEEWLCNNLHSASEEDFIKAMVDIAEPREKRIAELEKENDELKEKLAGLIAGKNMDVRSKWHKVADGDLPKNENDVLVYSGEEWRMCVGRYSPKNKAWEAGCDTVAWCEIPEYKGE